MRKFTFFIILVSIAMVGYYYSQNLNQLISSKEVEKILEKEMNDLAEVLQDIDTNTKVEWEKFSCSKDLVCVSPRITFKDDETNLFHFNNAIITIDQLSINEGKGKWSIDIEIDDQLITMINKTNNNQYDVLIKPFIPTSIACNVLTAIKGNEMLMINDNTCSIFTESANYNVTLGMDIVHPIYKDETFLSVIQDQTGKFKNLEQSLDQMDQLKIALKKFSFQVQSKTLHEALYALYLTSSPETSKEDFYNEVEQNLGSISLISQMLIQRSEDSSEALSTESQNQLSDKINQFLEGLLALIIGEQKELQIDITLKDMKNIKQFSIQDLEQGSKNLDYFNIEITTKK